MRLEYEDDILKMKLEVTGRNAKQWIDKIMLAVQNAEDEIKEAEAKQ